MTLDLTQAYRVLGLAPGATFDEVKTAYRDLAQVWHPDRVLENVRLREKAVRNLQRINEAFEVLRHYRAPAELAAPAHPSLGQRISATFGIGDLRQSGLFSAPVLALRRSLHVFWPDPKYHRRRRRLRRRGWTVVGLLLLVAAALAALWYEGLLGF